MKAFVISLVAMLVISAGAAVGLGMVPISSQQNFTVPGNVRL
ncbi:MAG TPA: hypothetical protein P5114_03590 [Hyphomicrobiaceae bacterium]|nr:hypothetical protein [Hyphomicrobiaceae bacterium]